ncbi:AsnC family protein [Salmonella enterica subsp. enterica serovar Anatum]|nr:AsnC family protein [Salmonella enterica subsp. enterica serovar Anatum]
MILKPMGTPGKCPAHLRPWTAADDELLVNLYPSMTIAEMAVRLGRTVKATSTRIDLLHQSGRLHYKVQRFTPKQDAFIRNNCKTMTAKEMAVHLKKSPGCIKARARILGVSLHKCGDYSRCVKHPDSDVVLIRGLRDEGISFEEIAGKFDISVGTTQWLYHHRLTADYAIAREYLP